MIHTISWIFGLLEKNPDVIIHFSNSHFWHKPVKYKVDTLIAYYNCYCLLLTTDLDAYVIRLFSKAVPLNTNLIFLYLLRISSLNVDIEVALLAVIFNISKYTCINQKMNWVRCLSKYHPGFGVGYTVKDEYWSKLLRKPLED